MLSLRPATLLKKQALAQMFSLEFCEILKDIFFTEHLQLTASANILEKTVINVKTIQKPFSFSSY